MRKYLSERFGRGRWTLNVDVDELFVYPYMDVVGLRSLPPLAFPPGLALGLFGPRRPRGRPLGFRGVVGAEPVQDLHAVEQVGSGILALLGLALLYRETSTKERATQRPCGGAPAPLSARRSR